MITCSFPRDHIYAGETAVCLLRGSQITESYDKAIIFAQIHGHISVDFRWLKATHKIHDVFVDEDIQTVDKTKLSVKDPHPVASHHSPCCIFTTSRVAVSPTHVFEGGTFLEFELPIGSLPTYRGLCASVYYFVSLIVQFQSGATTLHFPMPVQGSGTTEKPFLVRHTSLVAYPAASLPEEVLMSAPAPGSRAMRSTDGDGEAREVPNVFMIRDREHICDLHLPSKVAVVGRKLLISLDFSRCVQACTTVSATLVMSELRPDATRIQDKALCRASRVATDAEWLDLSLYVPDEAWCSFSTPLFMVAYRLNVEFTLQRQEQLPDASGKSSTNNGSNSGSRKADAEEDEPFSFSIPIQVYQEYQPRVPTLTIAPDEARPPLIGPWSAQFVQQQALLCLESNNTVRSV